MEIDSALIKKAAKIIREGGLVAFPTETVYGLGANAFNPIAVAKIFEVKKRPFFDPLIVHIADLKELEVLTSQIDKRALKLAEKFWPGPLTLVLPKSEKVPDIVTASLPTVAIRMPAHPIALALIKEANVPIAAPSANLFGHLSPTTAEHVRAQLGDSVDLIIDGGKCPVGVESTIIYLGETPLLLRPGGLPLEEIEKVIGPVLIKQSSEQLPLAPGQLPTHYAPRTPLEIKSLDEIVFEEGKKIGFLAFKPIKGNYPFYAVEVLSNTGDLREAAANLFVSLHKLDKAGVDIIYAEPVPEVGLGRAIMDRLRKASRKE